jgi:hypothetical protein
MTIDIVQTYRIEVSAVELRLICKALGGRLTKTEEIEQAKELDKCIAERRIMLAKHNMNEIEKLERNIEDSCVVSSHLNK